MKTTATPRRARATLHRRLGLFVPSVTVALVLSTVRTRSLPRNPDDLRPRRCRWRRERRSLAADRAADDRHGRPVWPCRAIASSWAQASIEKVTSDWRAVRPGQLHRRYVRYGGRGRARAGRGGRHRIRHRLRAQPQPRRHHRRLRRLRCRRTESTSRASRISRRSSTTSSATTSENGIYVQDSNHVLVFNNLVYGTIGWGSWSPATRSVRAAWR